MDKTPIYGFNRPTFSNEPNIGQLTENADLTELVLNNHEQGSNPHPKVYYTKQELDDKLENFIMQGDYISFEPSFWTSNRDFSGNYSERKGSYVVKGDYIYYEVRVTATNANGTGNLQIPLPMPVTSDIGFLTKTPYFYIAMADGEHTEIDRNSLYLSHTQADDRGVCANVFVRNTVNGQAILFDMDAAIPNGVVDLAGLIIYKVGV